MPGQTDNENHLDAYNQLIAAVNDIQAATQKLEEIRTVLETRSVAETAAQNTNFNDLITALQNLNFRCPPLLYRITYFGLDSELEPEQGIEFADPPPNWTIPSETPGSSAYYSRKCGVANQLVSNLEYIFTQLNQINVSNLANIADIGVDMVFATVLSILTNPNSGPFDTIAVVAGATWGIVKSLISFSIDFGNLTTITQGNRDDLVCALYEANDANGAISNLATEYGNNGASPTEQEFITDLLNLTGAANNLFYFRADVPPPPDPPYVTDCNDCSQVPCPDFQVIYGSLVSQNGNQYTFDSQYVNWDVLPPLGNWICIHLGQDSNGNTCGPAKNVRIISINQPPDASECSYRLSYNHFAAAYGCGNYRWDETANDWTPYIGVQKDAVRTLTLFRKGSSIQFQVVLEIT